MRSQITRRSVLRRGALAIALLPISAVLAPVAHSAALPPLDPNDPTAKALGFVSDSSKVDAARNPTHKAEQHCGTCAQFQGKSGDASGGCNIFAGHSVPAAGWCQVWAQKPAG